MNGRIPDMGLRTARPCTVRLGGRSLGRVLIGSLIALPAVMTMALTSASASTAAVGSLPVPSPASLPPPPPTTLPPLPGPLNILLPLPIPSTTTSGSPPPPVPPHANGSSSTGTGTGAPTSAPQAPAAAPVQSRPSATVAGTTRTAQLTTPTVARPMLASAAVSGDTPSGLAADTGSWRVLPPSADGGVTAAALPAPSFLSHLPLAGWALFAAIDLLLASLLLQRRLSWMRQWAQTRLHRRTRMGHDSSVG